MPETVSFELCGNSREFGQLHPRVKIELEGVETIVPSVNVTLQYDGARSKASLWNGASSGSKECQILVVRLWPSLFTSAESFNISLNLLVEVSRSQIPTRHNLSDVYKISFNFNGESVRGSEEELGIYIFC